MDDSEDEQTDDENAEPSGSDEMSSIEILKICERKAKQMNDYENIEKRKTWKNSHGETDLHMEAKGGNTVRLAKLLQHVC